MAIGKHPEEGHHFLHCDGYNVFNDMAKASDGLCVLQQRSVSAILLCPFHSVHR